ncbi:ankyrin repeat domain-containing protein [Thalassoglobus sp.]|uniref:ankyrin repeat domain-containing protein n=1 Tax=Thalassoglobus sp. TaxID=2795869 RepID=UPI003AA99DBF
MSEKETNLSDDVLQFHRAVENAPLESLRKILATGTNVNAPGRLEQTALMVAIAAKDLDKVQLLLEYGADPELTDCFNSTALGHAVDHDFVEAVQFLITHGVDRGYHPRYPLKQVHYDWDLLESMQVPMPEELRGIMSEDEWKLSTNPRDILEEHGQNPSVEPLITQVQSVECLQLFLDVGDNLSLAPTEIQRDYIGIGSTTKFQCTKKEYWSHKSPRFGSSNPEVIGNPFWNDMIRIGCNAYVARKRFKDDDPFSNPGPVWCYDRFGATLTPLSDGRFVQIGGEHEDYYDPDFCIYNDVVVHDGTGGFQIYGYPKENFPPTDFHTATLVENAIYVIGCLGYVDQREIGVTPVYRLELDTWCFEKVETDGDMPSWLHRHCAKFDASRNVITVEAGDVQVSGDDDNATLSPNTDQFELDLGSLKWRTVDHQPK